MNDTAERAFAWIESMAVDADGGSAWTEQGRQYDDLYSGTAGVLLGCAEAAAAGLDVSRVAEPALHRLRHLAGGAATAAVDGDGLFCGWAGVAVALRAWAAVAGDRSAEADAQRVSRGVAQRVLATRPDAEWCTDTISGDAGVLLALLGDPDQAAAAGVLADRLVGRSEAGPSGRQWRMDAAQVRLSPGFSHGTAGVAYALAEASRGLDRPDLLEVATDGAETLLTLGHTAQGWALPLTIPQHPDRPPVFFGWCHGPAGTARLFVLLDALDPQPRWRRAVDACAQAIADSGLPERRYPGFWDNVGRCCGTAGVGRFLLLRHQATGDPALLAWADRLAADVLGRTIESPPGVSWSNTEYTRTRPLLPPEPGFMQGAAGIAGWLAQLATAHRSPDAVRAPDAVGGLPTWI